MHCVILVDRYKATEIPKICSYCTLDHAGYGEVVLLHVVIMLGQTKTVEYRFMSFYAVNIIDLHAWLVRSHAGLTSTLLTYIHIYSSAVCSVDSCLAFCSFLNISRRSANPLVSVWRSYLLHKATLGYIRIYIIQ